MSIDNREQILKSAVTLLLNNLVQSDWIGVVIFSTVAETYNKKLVRATKANIQDITNYLNSKDVNGSTNYTDAFYAANNLIKDSVYENGTSPCKTFIMFLTDGVPSTGITTQTELINYIDGLLYLKKAVVFSYSLGDTANSVIPAAISCLRNGVHEHISNIGELTQKLNSYFTTLSLGMNVQKPLWVEPYIDASGLGEMTTCSMPVYDRSVNPIRFLGVVGIDLLMETFLKVQIIKDVIVNELVLRSNSACTNSNANECQINTLRNPEYRCSPLDGNCNVTILWETCSNTLNTNDVYCNIASAQVKSEGCCGSTPQRCTKENLFGTYIPLSIFFVIILSLFLII